MEQENVQMPEVSPDPGRGLHGVLRYRRELQDRRIRLQDFCCLRYREVFEEVVQETRIALKLSEEQSGRCVQAGDVSSSGEVEQELGAGESGSMEQRLQQKELERYYLEAAERLSSEISLFHTNTISFRLSGSVPMEESRATKQDCSEERKPNLWNWHSTSGSRSAEFGLSHHQNNARFIQKFYTNGNKFLTGLPDGSAQVFYPSGNLAIILLTNEKDSVCVVHDDVSTYCPIRALFQSSGRATCYHGNGSVWLSMDTWGGQSLDEGGTRTRRWSWTDHTQTPTPLKPIFLSLNQNVGVRVLGRQHIFVSFLASGQQTRFTVGSCIKQTQLKEGDSPSRRPPLCKEELFLLACRVYIRLALIRPSWCHHRPADSWHQLVRPPPGLLAVGRKLLSLSQRVHMADADRAFIQHCLQDCQ
ncbi:glutamate-rich protein 6 isoform X2 [Electrophorus electricus]|uniref:FAM194 C-terminal domain-containing protein n=1 Tax=Electrophorus electricus TaxID=8005 RepID=A0A4W4FG85_ELEEL|nr:glutamate-rich protein 6 isoform X2 [Electrophorus electricus]